ncbi:MAG TPA: class I SAM-dependent methyltransferase, partial [Phenylobacterium sp.]|nr:class I SAM-dependent methyltransferase [Phenylobacterium sp.]
LSPVVGPRGRVIAQDVMPDYLRRLDAEARRQGLSNITLALGDPHDPRLPAHSLDAAILIHMYHEIEQPYGLLYNLAGALKPGAKVGVEDLERATNRHGIPAALLRCEFEAVGYTHLSTAPMTGDLGYFSVFGAPERPTPPERIRPCR